MKNLILLLFTFVLSSFTYSNCNIEIAGININKKYPLKKEGNYETSYDLKLKGNKYFQFLNVRNNYNIVFYGDLAKTLKENNRDLLFSECFKYLVIKLDSPLVISLVNDREYMGAKPTKRVEKKVTHFYKWIINCNDEYLLATYSLGFGKINLNLDVQHFETEIKLKEELKKEFQFAEYNTYFSYHFKDSVLQKYIYE